MSAKVYKQIFTPDEQHHSVNIPEMFFGKKIEVIVTEIGNSSLKVKPIPPAGKVVSAFDLLEYFGEAPDFPSIEEIRAKGWPSKW